VWCSGRDLNPGPRLERPWKPTVSIPSLSLNWRNHKEMLVKWMVSRGYSDQYRKDVLRYLSRYVGEICGPSDVIDVCSNVQRGRRHLVLALRVLFNFYEAMGVDREFLQALRDALPKVKCGIDLKIPSESEIVESLRRLIRAPLKYQALYSLLLDSGLRLIEAIRMINSFDGAESVNGFYRCALAMFRGEKQAYYCHFTEATYRLILKVDEKIDYGSAFCYYKKMGYVRPKYLRKFVFDKMVELGIPESVADFIEGRVPRTIGAKHYMALARQSGEYYPRFAEYVNALRVKAGF